MIKRVQAQVHGRVQGVGYRYFATHVAQDLSLVGIVRNTHDGGVEAIAEGEEAELHKFLVALHHGPQSAEVTEVATAWGDPVGGYASFSAVS